MDPVWSSKDVMLVEGSVFMMISVQQDAEITSMILILQDAWFMVFSGITALSVP